MSNVAAVAVLAASALASASPVDPARLAMVNAVNSASTTWKAGVDHRFGSLPVGASKSLLGVKDNSRDELLAMVAAGKVQRAPMQNVQDLPDSFDSADNWPQCRTVIEDIRDQSNCGCCWAFAAAESASDRLCINTNGNITVSLSAQDTCFCAENSGCNGGTLYTAWDYIHTTGIVTGGQFNGTGPFGTGLCSDFSLPHCHHHGPQGDDPYPAEGSPGCPKVTTSPQCPTQCGPSAKAPHDNFLGDKYSFNGTIWIYPSDADQIAAVIMNQGPVEAAFSVYSDFENYVGGVYQHTTGSTLGGHAIRIVGWGVDNGVKYWKVANSWNPYWGEAGYFRILRGTDECGIESQVTGSGPDAVWYKK